MTASWYKPKILSEHDMTFEHKKSLKSLIKVYHYIIAKFFVKSTKEKLFMIWVNWLIGIKWPCHIITWRILSNSLILLCISIVKRPYQLSVTTAFSSFMSHNILSHLFIVDTLTFSVKCHKKSFYIYLELGGYTKWHRYLYPWHHPANPSCSHRQLWSNQTIAWPWSYSSCPSWY